MAKRRRNSGFLNYPQPTKEQGQDSINVTDLYLTRVTPPWSRPASLPAYTWRAWVLNQPVATVCKETLVANLVSLDWKITPRDMSYKEQLSSTVKYYTRLLERGGNYSSLGLDYVGMLEWIIGDMLDLPFGGAAEIGRKNDAQNGRVLWIKPLDAGTLYPTLNDEVPVVQYYQGYDFVGFPAHSIARGYLSPHQYLFREGWGMAPPEKVYMAVDLLNKGDKYYADLLLDVPTSGILDLGDMEKSSAEEWVEAFRTFVNDTDTSFRIPVLYEHNNEVKFIPFGRVPNDIMYDRITLKYAALVCAAYGMTLGDIGLQGTSSSGETLAGSIRQERKTRKTGFARLKRKWKHFIDQILPPSLEFNLIDYDDELNVALGRARLATSTAFNTFLGMKTFNRQELRSQIIADGLVSISIPDTLPDDSTFEVDTTAEVTERPGALGTPVPPSSGGEGEVKSLAVSLSSIVPSFTMSLLASYVPKFNEYKEEVSEDDFGILVKTLSSSLFSNDDEYELIKQLKSVLGHKQLASITFEGFESKSSEGKAIKSEFNELVAKSIAYLIIKSVFSEEMFDKYLHDDYDYIVDEVVKSINRMLYELGQSIITESNTGESKNGG